MAVRDDISVAWYVSPRVITVHAPSTEVTIQDLHDTLRDLEDEPANLIYNSIISSAGKENLGGSVSVGLTATLLDAQLSFESRDSPYLVGTATGGSQFLLTDSVANFISSGVVRGDLVANLSDGSHATVLNIIDANNLQISPLSGGSANTFISGDSYNIWHVVQCNVSGGNLVAVDDNGGEINPILSTFGTQVIRTSSSSATLLELASIEFGSFDGGVWINNDTGIGGVAYPIGTPLQPVNNLQDAQTIAVSRGFKKIFISGILTCQATDNLSGYWFVGDAPHSTSITITSGCETDNATFQNITVSGVLSNGGDDVTLIGCHIGNLDNVSGLIMDSVIEGTVKLDGGLQCVRNVDGLAGSGTPTIDLNGSGKTLEVRDYFGGLELINKTGTDAVSINLSAGRLVIDSTVVAGTIELRGVGELVNNGSATINGGLVSAIEIGKIKSETGIIPGLV